MGRLEEIKSRCEKATKGPWNYFEDEEEEGKFSFQSHRDAGNLVSTPDLFFTNHGFFCEQTQCSKNDGEFIAHSREDIPYLLGAIEKLASFNEASSKEG